MLIIKVSILTLIGLLFGYLAKYYAVLTCASDARLCPVHSCCVSCKKRIPILECFKQIVMHKPCKCCGNRLSFKYHFIEFGIALFFAVGAVFIEDFFKLIAYCVLASLLMVTSVVDIKIMKIPYFSSLGILLVGLIILISSVSSGSNWWKNQLLGAALIAVLFIFPTLLGKAGGGDFHLLVAGGFVLGTKGIVAAVLITIILGFCRSVIAVICTSRSIVDKYTSVIHEVVSEWYDEQQESGVSLKDDKTDTIYLNIVNDKINIDESCYNIAKWAADPNITALKEGMEHRLIGSVAKMAVVIKLESSDSGTLNIKVKCKRVIPLAPYISVGILVSYLLCV